MPLGSSGSGGRYLGTLDFTKFDRDQVVIHFGGSIASVDAYTFANSLIAFADTVRAVNAVINPGQDIEIRLEAQGPGSYRAVIRRIRKGVGGFFSRGAESIFWGIVATLIYEHVIKHDPDVKVIVKTEEVIIEHGGDRVIVPRNVYEAMPNVRKSPEVQRNLSRTFKTIESDEAITNFGLTTNIDDAEPVLLIPRDEFVELSEFDLTVEDHEKIKNREETVRLLILKAWLTHSSRKWSFEWNGVPISAPIKDDDFLDKIDRREYLIGSGDALDAILSYRQSYDESLGLYINDPNSFVIKRVIKPVPRVTQQRLPS